MRALLPRQSMCSQVGEFQSATSFRTAPTIGGADRSVEEFGEGSHVISTLGDNTAEPTTILFRILAAIGRHGAGIQFVSQPVFAIRHRPGGIDLSHPLRGLASGLRVPSARLWRSRQRTDVTSGCTDPRRRPRFYVDTSMRSRLLKPHKRCPLPF